MKITKKQAIILCGKSEYDTDVWATYSNSPWGRKNLYIEQSPDIVKEVMEVWGNTPTVPDPEPPLPPTDTTPPPPTLEERIAALEAVQLEQILGGAV